MELITAEEARNMKAVPTETEVMEYIMKRIKEEALDKDYLAITDLSSTQDKEVLKFVRGSEVTKDKLNNLGYSVTFDKYNHYNEIIHRMFISWGDCGEPISRDRVMVNSRGEKLLPIGTMVKVIGQGFAISGMTLEIIGYDNSVYKDYTDTYVLAYGTGKRYLHYKDVQVVD